MLSIIGVNSKGSDILEDGIRVLSVEKTSQCWGPNGNATNARACNKINASHNLVQTKNPL